MTTPSLLRTVFASNVDLPESLDGDPGQEADRVLEAEVAELEAVATAAVLAAAAFRLKDERGLVAALRHLVMAVDHLERLREAA